MNAKLQRDIAPVSFDHAVPERIGPGTVAFQGAPNAVHNDFVTRAYKSDPLADLLARIELSRLGEASDGTAPR